MTDNEFSLLHFIPIGRVIPDAVEIATAVSMAIFDRPSADADMYQDGNGDLVIRILNIRTGKPENFRPGEDHSPAQEYAIALTHGGAVLTKAMLEGRIEAFIISDDGRYLRVPRLYWLKANLASSTILVQTGSIPEHLVGKPVLVDPQHVPRWREIAEPEIESMLKKTRAASGEVVPINRVRTAKQGRNKARTAEIDRQIFDMFRQSHDHLARMTEERRAEAITNRWAGPSSAPSKNTVARRWNDWLDKRASEARGPTKN